MKDKKELCIFCQAELEKNQQFCHCCGAKHKNEDPGDAPQDTHPHVCWNCGETLSANQKYCHMCGSVYIEKPTTCQKCGEPLIDGAFYCAACGTSVNAPKNDVKPKSSAKKVFASLSTRVKNNKANIVDFTKKFLLLVLSLALVILAFVPIYETEVYVKEIREDLEIEFTAVDGIVFLFDSMSAHSDEELLDTLLYEKIQRLTEKHSVRWAMGEDTDELSRMIKYSIRLSLSKDTVKTSASFVICALISFAYLALALTILVLSTISFVSLLKKKSRNFESLILKLLAIVPVLTVVLLSAYNIAYVSGNVKMLSAGMVSNRITVAPIAMIALSLLMLAAFAVYRLLTEKKEKTNKSVFIKRALACIFALALLFLSFAPVMSTGAKTVFDGKSTAQTATAYIDASYFTRMDLSEEQVRTYKNLSETELVALVGDQFDSLSDYSKRDYEHGFASENETLVKHLSLAFGAYRYSGVLALGGLLSVITAICAAIILWQVINAAVLGEPMKKRWVIPAKAVAVFTAVATLLLVIIIVSLANYNIAEISTIKYKVYVAGGIIASVVFALLTAAIPVCTKNNIVTCQVRAESVPCEEAVTEEAEVVEVSEIAADVETSVTEDE